MSFSQSDRKLTVTVGDTGMTFADGTGVTVNGGSKLTLKATEIAIEGDVKVKVKGSMVELN